MFNAFLTTKHLSEILQLSSEFFRLETVSRIVVQNSEHNSTNTLTMGIFGKTDSQY